MHVIFGKENVKEFEDKFVVMPLDKIKAKGSDTIVEVFCVIPATKVPLQEIALLEKLKNMHVALMQEYTRQNWNFCFDAIGHLRGKFNGELDTFYDELENRISKLQAENLSAEWDGVYEQV